MQQIFKTNTSNQKKIENSVCAILATDKSVAMPLNFGSFFTIRIIILEKQSEHYALKICTQGISQDLHQRELFQKKIYSPTSFIRSAWD
jgi:hypothetical protein